MKRVKFFDFKRDMGNYVKKICEKKESFIIERNNKKNMVLISEKEYSSLMETMYLLERVNNAKHLFKSIEQARKGR